MAIRTVRNIVMEEGVLRPQPGPVRNYSGQGEEVPPVRSGGNPPPPSLVKDLANIVAGRGTSTKPTSAGPRDPNYGMRDQGVPPKKSIDVGPGPYDPNFGMRDQGVPPKKNIVEGDDMLPPRGKLARTVPDSDIGRPGVKKLSDYVAALSSRTAEAPCSPDGVTGKVGDCK